MMDQGLELNCDEVFSGSETNWKNNNGQCFFFHESKYFQLKNLFIFLTRCPYFEEQGVLYSYPFEK